MPMRDKFKGFFEDRVGGFFYLHLVPTEYNSGYGSEKAKPQKVPLKKRTFDVFEIILDPASETGIRMAKAPRVIKGEPIVTRDGQVFFAYYCRELSGYTQAIDPYRFYVDPLMMMRAYGYPNTFTKIGEALAEHERQLLTGDKIPVDAYVELPDFGPTVEGPGEVDIQTTMTASAVAPTTTQMPPFNSATAKPVSKWYGPGSGTDMPSTNTSAGKEYDWPEKNLFGGNSSGWKKPHDKSKEIEQDLSQVKVIKKAKPEAI